MTAAARVIPPEGPAVTVAVVPTTDEEVKFARQTVALLDG